MSKFNCRDCEKDDKTGFNYCRSCGDHLRKGYAQTRLAICRQGTDKFCGNCGKKVRECSCQ